MQLQPLLLRNLIVPTDLTLSETLPSLYCVTHFNYINGLYLLVLPWLFRSSITRRSSFQENPDSRTVLGHLLFWDDLQDQVPYTLSPPKNDRTDSLAYCATILARLTPPINIDEFTDVDASPPLLSRRSPIYLIDLCKTRLLRKRCLAILWLLTLHLWTLITQDARSHSCFDSCLHRSSTSRSAHKTNFIFHHQFNHIPSMGISELYA